MMNRKEATEILSSLRWQDDLTITNPFGERVWLKKLLDANGNIIGITDCCNEAYPCELHKKLAKVI